MTVCNGKKVYILVEFVSCYIAKTTQNCEKYYLKFGSCSENKRQIMEILISQIF